ncbi:helix-turn-helix domain-containing protein [Zoogloea dura]|uniref:helix-turn-helix domain-containing protein n=1 Tax=Zoogloea dura TaxID=2728840 RepID=UPI0038B5CA65
MPESALLATVAELRAPFNDLPRSTAAAFSIEKWSTGRDLAAQRTALGLTQTAFLGGLGVQSGGARYEQGREIPPSAAVALRFVFCLRRRPCGMPRS